MRNRVENCPSPGKELGEGYVIFYTMGREMPLIF